VSHQNQASETSFSSSSKTKELVYYANKPPQRPIMRGDMTYAVWGALSLSLGLLSAGRRACRRVCWGGAGECSCGAPAAARLLPPRVWRADARGLSRCSHRMKASAGSTRPTQSSSQTPQGGNTTGGKQHTGKPTRQQGRLTVDAARHSSQF